MKKKQERSYDFQDFHKSTEADFLPASVPDREPDFVSGSGSAYWDAGDGVFRASDHWAGLNGCTGQASCYWTILDAARPHAWLSGYCGYSSFRPRAPRRGPDLSRLTERDREAAILLRRCGGAMAFDGYAPPPVWALMFINGSSFTHERADEMFRTGEARRRVVLADAAIISEVLRLTGGPSPA